MSAPEENLAHAKWECKCHVVFIHKISGKSLFGLFRMNPGDVSHELAHQKQLLGV